MTKCVWHEWWNAETHFLLFPISCSGMRDTGGVTSGVCNHCNQLGACLRLPHPGHNFTPFSTFFSRDQRWPTSYLHSTLHTIYYLHTIYTRHWTRDGNIPDNAHTKSLPGRQEETGKPLAAFYLSSVFFILLVFCLVSNQSSTKPNWSPRTVVQNIYKSFSLALNLVSGCLHLNLYRMPISMNRSLSWVECTHLSVYYSKFVFIQSI